MSLSENNFLPSRCLFQFPCTRTVLWPCLGGQLWTSLLSQSPTLTCPHTLSSSSFESMACRSVALPSKLHCSPSLQTPECISLSFFSKPSPEQLANPCTAHIMCQALSASHIITQLILQYYEEGTILIAPFMDKENGVNRGEITHPNPKAYS